MIEHKTLADMSLGELYQELDMWRYQFNKYVYDRKSYKIIPKEQNGSLNNTTKISDTAKHNVVSEPDVPAPG